MRPNSQHEYKKTTTNEWYIMNMQSNTLINAVFNISYATVLTWFNYFYWQ